MEHELARSTEKDDEKFLLPADGPEFEDEAPQPEDQPRARSRNVHWPGVSGS